MAVYVMQAESLALETCVLSLVSGYTLFLVVLTFPVVVHVTHITGLLLLAAACAYGICATDVEHRFSRNFSRCSAALAGFSCVGAIAHTGFLIEYYQTFLEGDSPHMNLERSTVIPFKIVFIFVILLKAVELGLAGVLGIKHVRIVLHQGPRICSTMVPTALPMQESRLPNYPQDGGNLPSKQVEQLLVGQRAYV